MSIAVTLVNYEWQIGVSYWLMRLLAVGSFLALIACFMNALALLIKLGLASLVLLQALQTWQQFSVCHWYLNYEDENSWKIIESNRIYPIEILSSTVISQCVIFLHYRNESKKHYRLIFKDALFPNASNFRQLIMALKIAH